MDEAEFRAERLFADEFGIETDQFSRAEVCDAFGEASAIGNKCFGEFSGFKRTTGHFGDHNRWNKLGLGGIARIVERRDFVAVLPSEYSVVDVTATLTLEQFLNRKVVVDFRAEYVCLGTLKSIGEHFLELKNADLHDLRDTETSRENYIAACVITGIKRNRKRLLVSRSEIVAIADFEDIVEQ